MDKDLSMLFQAVAMNDINTAKSYAESFCLACPNAFPPDFHAWLLQRLADKTSTAQEQKPKQLTIENIPPEVASLIVFESVEDMLHKFNPRRYWVSSREQILLDDIISKSRIAEKLAKAQIPYSNTTLLYGMPGTGKTQFGRYVAYVLKRPFIYVDLCRVSGMHHGETGRNLQVIFEFVQTVPCVFVMDEIDAIGANRGAIGRGGSSDESVRTTLALMQCMDRVRQDVVIIATTNRVDMLDAALRRRFSIQHEIKAFLIDERTDMVFSYLNDVKETGNLEITWDEEDIKKQCSKMAMNQSEIINLCNRAVIRAISFDNVVRLTDEANLFRNGR